MILKAALAAVPVILLVAIALPAHGQKSSLAMLDQIERGGWELRERGGDGSVRNICLDSARRLIQFRHPGLACRNVVVDDAADHVTVQYTCPGQGFGRTQIRRETGKLIQIDTQGIVNGLPFSYSAEGRRTGDCHG